jgi:hypothetical protein
MKEGATLSVYCPRCVSCLSAELLTCIKAGESSVRWSVDGRWSAVKSIVLRSESIDSG